jgi:hypothetical protein
MGSQAWRLTPVISALRKQRQEDLEFKVNPGYIESSRSQLWNRNPVSKKKKKRSQEMNEGKEEFYGIALNLCVALDCIDSLTVFISL